ncbi:hypothetical protein OG474_09625 [Kribbella sp. NBC_01505]|uniref:hypothetical protein n=1 Tax=Kribbella sp. NBC_01505 TaxID=2903580 RepID=UPI003869CCD1
MTLPPLATVADMEVRLRVEVGSLAGLDLVAAQTSLKDASALVRSVSNPVTWVDPDDDSITAPDEVLTIIVRAAVRDFRNPSGVNNEAMGSGAYSYTFAAGEATVYLSEDEVAMIKKAAKNSGTDPEAWKGVGTIRTPSAYYDPGTGPPDPFYGRWTL